MIQVLSVKVVCTVALGVSVFVVGLLPILLKAVNKGCLSLLTSFSGGVLLATVLLHLLPEVITYGDTFKCLMDIKHEYPIAELAILSGFILILLIEKLVEEKKGRCTEAEERPLLQRDTEVATTSTNTTNTTQVQHAGTARDKLTERGKSEVVQQGGSTSSHTVGSYLLVMALAIHSVFEGLAIGIAESISDTITLFLAVTIHKLCLAFALGLKLQQEHRSRQEHSVAIAMFAMSSPIGVMLGIAITKSLEESSLTIAMFVTNSIATGTFLYITFMEIIGPEFVTRHINQIYKVLSVIAGILVIMLSLYFFHDYDFTECKQTKHIDHGDFIKEIGEGQ